ncbi:MAG: hypothetical protein KA375_16185 [Vitreoscilla sp.]|nr:hypothetical protein [Vitreoscilla sp.]MBP6677111.1 hypothetical protein [Vitreoscilla sp.]
MIALPDAPGLGAAHRRRLRALWRSAGWPSHDMLELELLAAGLVERREDAQGRETLRVTDTGVALLADALQRNRARRDAHEALVARVASEMQRAGRIAWRGLALRAPLADVVAGPGGATAPKTRWAVAMPDVFSVRNTTAEALLWPVVHEVKVTRADLLGDLKRPAKGEAYRAVASECWYVLRAGIGEPEEIPEIYGVMCAHPAAGELVDGQPGFGALEVLRPAPRRPFSLPFSVWMALAKATPEPFDDTDAQALLGDDGPAPALE